MNPRYLRNLADEEISQLLNSRLRVERVKASAYLTRMGHNYHKELLRLKCASKYLDFNLDTYTICLNGLEIARDKT
jgi:hypothetical protein